MKNFEYYNPVRIYFGKGQISQLSKQFDRKSRVLLLYGGGSIKRNGVYEQVKDALAGCYYEEFQGVKPNPVYEDLLPAIDQIRKGDLNFILAVGGGSVIDAAKFIAAAARFQGDDPWDILLKQAPVTDAVPIGTVLTLPATGTEMNANSVITRRSLAQKLAFGSPLVMPVFSVLDPTVTYSLPKHQLANGVIDAYVHVIEQYLTYPSQAEVQERFAESLLKILRDIGSSMYVRPEPNYDERANFMWAATNALNGAISMGVVSDWATHTLGHELTVLYGWDHAVTLSIVLPGLLRFVKEKRVERLNQYAERIWGISTFDPLMAAEEAIHQTEQMFRCLGVKTRFSEYGVGYEVVDKVVNQLKSRGATVLGRSKDVTIDDVAVILGSQVESPFTTM